MYIVALGSICFSPTSPSLHLLCHRHSNAHGDNINLGDLLGADWTKQPIWNILQKSKGESSRKRCLVTSSFVTVLVTVGSWNHLQLGKSRKGKWTPAGNLLYDLLKNPNTAHLIKMFTGGSSITTWKWEDLINSKIWKAHSQLFATQMSTKQLAPWMQWQL